MSLINNTAEDYFNGGTFYNYAEITFYRHGTIWGAWQDLHALSTYQAFVDYVDLQGPEQLHPAAQILIANFYLLIQGKKYYSTVIYTSDLTICPDGQPIHAYIVDPTKEDYIRINPTRKYDMYYLDIVKELNASYQMYMNLQIAAKHIEDTINLITPIKGNIPDGQKQKNILEQINNNDYVRNKIFRKHSKAKRNIYNTKC